MNAPAESPVVSETPSPQAVATDPALTGGGVAAPGAQPSKTPPPALVWVTLAISGVALALGVVLWQRLDRIQQELVRRAAQVAEDATGARITAEQAQTLTQGLQARLAVAEVKLSEVSLQRSQLEELMLSMSRSRDDTLVLDIESGLRLASQQAELTGSVQPLVSALLAADRRIAKAAQPRLNPVQRAMARDIGRPRSPMCPCSCSGWMSWSAWQTICSCSTPHPVSAVQALWLTLVRRPKPTQGRRPAKVVKPGMLMCPTALGDVDGPRSRWGGRVFGRGWRRA